MRTTGMTPKASPRRFAPDVEVRTLGDTAVKRGQAAVRNGMSAWFRKAPRVHARLIGRMVQGAFVVDHERFTGTPDEMIQAGLLL